MLYTIIGFLIPTENEYKANSLIIDIGNTLLDKGLIQDTTPTITGVQEVHNIKDLGQNLVKFLEDYYNNDINKSR